MKEIIVTGETLDEAKFKALRALALGNDDRIQYEVLDFPKKGFLGLWGSQPAKLKVSIEIKNKINKIDVSAAMSEEAKARLLLGEDFDDVIICWAGIYVIKTNKDIPNSLALQSINGLWEKIGIDKGPSFLEKVKAFFLLINEKRLADEMNILNRFYAGEFKWKSNLENEALSNGISVEQLIEIRKRELERYKQFRKMQEEKLKKLEEPAKKVKKIYPQFDLELEIQDPLFMNLVDARVDMQIVFEVLNKDYLFQKKCQLETSATTSKKTIDEFFDILSKHDDILQKFLNSPEPDESEENLLKEAEETGYSIEQLKELNQMQRDTTKLGIKTRTATCKEQSIKAEKLQHEYPLFDIDKELSNPLFRRLVFQGIDLHLVYELVHFNELYERKSIS